MRPTSRSACRRSGVGPGVDGERRDGEVDRAAESVELVIQTASGVLTGRFGGREAVTILASQIPPALRGGPVLIERTPERAERYAELLRSIGAELAEGAEGEAEGRQRREVGAELARVVRALTP